MICSIEDRKNKSLLLAKEERQLAPPLKLWKHVDAVRTRIPLELNETFIIRYYPIWQSAF